MKRHVPADETARLAALAACAIMDTGREAAFDSIVFTAAQMFRAPIALLTLVDDTRVWAKAAVGPIGRTSVRSESFCNHVIADRQLLVVEDATTDGRFSGMPGVVSEPYIRFFAGAPLLGPNQQLIGALCVLDRLPRSVAERQRRHLLQLAAEAGELLRLRVPNLDVSA